MQASHTQKKLALLYLDLDDFKPINDTHGHGTGDSVLKIIAKRLKQVIRDDDTVSRLGGDEFGIYPDNGSEPEVLLKKADVTMYHVKQAGKNQYRLCNNIKQPK